MNQPTSVVNRRLFLMSSAVGLVAAWQALVVLLDIPEYLLPSPLVISCLIRVSSGSSTGAFRMEPVRRCNDPTGYQ